MSFQEFFTETKRTVFENDYQIITKNNGLDLAKSDFPSDIQKSTYIKEVLDYFESEEEYEKCGKLKLVLDIFESK